MAEVRRPPVDQRKLLLADGQLSLSALQRSLSVGAAGGGEAALHVTDLASLLSVLGFKPEADGLKELARGLSEDPSVMLETVRHTLTELQQLLSAVEADDVDQISVLRQSMALRLNIDKPPAHLPLEEVAVPVPEPLTVPAVATPKSSAQWPEIAPFFSAGLTLPPYAALAVAVPPPPAAPTPFQASWVEVRGQALETVQATSHRLHAQQGAAALPVVQELGVTQDGLMRVGQVPLLQAYPEAASAADLWVDPPVLALLEHLQIFSQRASRVSLQLRHLTLFVTWQGATLTQAELVHVGHRVAELHGRVDVLDAGMQLVLPVSQQRMRLVSFSVVGQWHTASWAQFLGWASADASGSPVMQLRAGVTELTVRADAAGTVSNMNLYPWPGLVPAPAELVAVALDGTGKLHQFHRRGA